MANVWQITGTGVGEFNGLPFHRLVNITGGSAADASSSANRASLTGDGDGGTGSDGADQHGPAGRAGGHPG